MEPEQRLDIRSATQQPSATATPTGSPAAQAKAATSKVRCSSAVPIGSDEGMTRRLDPMGVDVRGDW
jgi:hypothetical protein